MSTTLAKLLAMISTVFVVSLIVLNWPGKRSSEEKLQDVAAEQIEVVPIVQDEIIEPIPFKAAEEPLVETAIENHYGIESISSDESLPADVDRIQELFQTYPPNLPFVETVTYVSRVPWLTGRSAYLGDYAAHYQTSKHFIARSLHGAGCYLADNVSKGDRFNVFRKDKTIEFHLVLDLSRLKMWFYAFDSGANERTLLKTYRVCVGHLDPTRSSGSLTPTGVFLLGNEIAVYKEGAIGNFKNEPREMITIFGKRWIPFNREIADCTGSAKGLGIHGVPWTRNLETNQIHENRECIGHYDSEGCIRMLTEDIEELFAIVATKPTYIHIVRDFCKANLPGKEKI